MRKKGSTFALAEERDRDLYRAYRELIKKQLLLYGRINETGLMGKLVHCPASRYWVSSERASCIIYKMNKGKSIDYMKKNAIHFYESLYEEFCKYRNLHPDASIKEIVEIAIQQPAPCFLLSPRVASQIIYRMKKICLKETVKRLKNVL